MRPLIKSRANKRLINIIHFSSGRARFAVDALYRSPSIAQWLERAFFNQEGINTVVASWRTGTLLIIFNPTLFSLKSLTDKINKHLTNENTNIEKEYYQRKFPVKKKPIQVTSPHPWHYLTKEQVVLLFSSSMEYGLSEEQAQAHLRLYGTNWLIPPKKRLESEIFWRQFQNLPVLLLFGSAGLSLLTGGILDSAVILSVVLINGYLGYVTESSAEKTVNLLNKAVYPDVYIVRNQKMRLIKVEDIALGDILALTPGTLVPADARIIRADNLYLDESILTGESLPINKTHKKLQVERLTLADRTNMVFRGTTVISGSGMAVVVATGSSTELGSIQNLMGDSNPPETPLQKQLHEIGKKMVGASLGISFMVFSIGILRRENFLNILKTAISLAVAAIPEGLPAVATVAFATGIKRLKKRNLLVRHLDAVETLGNIDVICFDKTGTLTLNKMEVLSLIIENMGLFKVRDRKILQDDHAIKVSDYPSLLQMIKVLVLCNEAESKAHSISGSATEAALLRLAMEANINCDELRAQFPMISIQYRSLHQNYMITVHRNIKDEKKIFIAAKGTPSEILARCTHYLKDEKPVLLSLEDKIKIEQANKEMAEEALRVLGIAYQELNDNADTKETPLIWLGLVGLRDSIRPEVKGIIKTLHHAGIKTIMITGDQTATARAVGEELNINGQEQLSIVDCAQIMDYDKNAFLSLVEKAHIFSKVSPAYKLHIIKALQQSGKTVAMAGDGINDGPALKVADIGIAMAGQNFDLAQRVADLVVLKNNLSSLIPGIEEGRAVHSNLKKAVNYIISQNLSEMIYTFVSVAIGFKEPLTPLQLLWLNLVTDILPELALSQEPPEFDVLKKGMEQGNLISKSDLKKVGVQAFVLSFASLAGYFYGVRKYGIGSRARTMGFITLNTASLLHTYSSRSDQYSIFSRSRLQNNKYIPYSIGAGLLAEFVAIYGPFFRKFLKTAPLPVKDLLVTLMCSATPYFIIEGIKFGHNKKLLPKLASKTKTHQKPRAKL